MSKARRLSLLMGTFLVALSLTVAGCGGSGVTDEKKKEAKEEVEKKEEKDKEKKEEEK